MGLSRLICLVASISIHFGLLLASLTLFRSRPDSVKANKKRRQFWWRLNSHTHTPLYWMDIKTSLKLEFDQRSEKRNCEMSTNSNWPKGGRQIESNQGSGHDEWLMRKRMAILLICLGVFWSFLCPSELQRWTVELHAKVRQRWLKGNGCRPTGRPGKAAMIHKQWERLDERRSKSGWWKIRRQQTTGWWKVAKTNDGGGCFCLFNNKREKVMSWVRWTSDEIMGRGIKACHASVSVFFMFGCFTKELRSIIENESMIILISTSSVNSSNTQSRHVRWTLYMFRTSASTRSFGSNARLDHFLLTFWLIGKKGGKRK